MDNLIREAKYDESYENEYYGTVTHYFIAPVELLAKWLRGSYPDAVSAEISIEVPVDYQEASEASVCISPTRDEDGCLTDYDWNAVEIGYDEIEFLLELAKMCEGGQMKCLG